MKTSTEILIERLENTKCWPYPPTNFILVIAEAAERLKELHKENKRLKLLKIFGSDSLKSPHDLYEVISKDELNQLRAKLDEAEDILDSIGIVFEKHFGDDTLSTCPGGFPNTVECFAKDVRSLKAKLEEKNKERDGNWLDKHGCCKVCDGEIPHGHMPNCDILKLEEQIRELQRG